MLVGLHILALNKGVLHDVQETPTEKNKQRNKWSIATPNNHRNKHINGGNGRERSGTLSGRDHHTSRQSIKVTVS